jgi:hypothetical protein
MAPADQHVEKFLLPPFGAGASLLIGVRPRAYNRHQNIPFQLFKYQKSWPNMNQGEEKSF